MPPLWGSQLEYCHPVWCGKLEWWGYPMDFEDIYHLDRILECARQDGQPDRHLATA